jgi:hypothetical protein
MSGSGMGFWEGGVVRGAVVAWRWARVVERVCL